ncbi:hypothetical protein GCM10010236_74280 [Streptomyces eurythermus]|nr:hypothetical protein GCM10010236_74280 [Streptomyces eurythermus]
MTRAVSVPRALDGAVDQPLDGGAQVVASVFVGRRRKRAGAGPGRSSKAGRDRARRCPGRRSAIGGRKTLWQELDRVADMGKGSRVNPAAPEKVLPSP